MCQAKTAVEMLKQHRSLSKGDIIMVFEKVIEDQKVANQDIKDVKRDMAELKIDVAVLKSGMDDIKELILKKQRTIWDKIPLLKEVPKFVWIILWTALLIIGAICGVNPEFVKYIKGG